MVMFLTGIFALVGCDTSEGHNHGDDHHTSFEASAEVEATLRELAQANPEVPSTTQQQTVVASIHPIALIAGVIVPADQITTLVPPNKDPHNFALKPSDVRKIYKADIVLWSGAKAEPYLATFEKRWKHQTWINLSAFSRPSLQNNPHFWLSTEVAEKAIDQLSKIIEVPIKTHNDEFKTLRSSISTLLSPLSDQGFVVSHSAYDHWVDEWQLNQVGSLADKPDQSIGLKTLSSLRKLIQNGEVTCIFSEPGYPSSSIDNLRTAAVRGAQLNVEVLDPLGRHIDIAPSGYLDFQLDLAKIAARCLKRSE